MLAPGRCPLHLRTRTKLRLIAIWGRSDTPVCHSGYATRLLRFSARWTLFYLELDGKVDYLGHVITPGKLHVATGNTQAFESAKFPKSVTQLRSFLGAATVYRRFVKDYEKVARPLNSMLSRDAELDWDDPTPEQIEAFEAFVTLKARLVAPPILRLAMKDRPFMIDSDASANQLGATLVQQQSDERPTECPVSFFPLVVYFFGSSSAPRVYSFSSVVLVSVDPGWS